jgi:hypothetical protein
MGNRDLPIPSDAAGKLVGQASKRAMTSARPLPKVARWSAIRLLIGFVILAALLVWLGLRYDSMLYIAGLMGILFGIQWWLSCRRRCPDCMRRLVPFAEDIYGGSQYRQLFKCSGCGGIWDSGEIGDHNVDNTSPG